MKVALENNAEKKKELIDNLFKKFEADRLTVDSYSKDHYYCEFQDEETGQMHHVESYDNLISDYNNLKSRGLLTHNDAVDFEVYDLQPIENQRSYIEDLLHNIGKTAAHFYKEGELKEEGGIEKPEKTKPEKTK